MHGIAIARCANTILNFANCNCSLRCSSPHNTPSSFFAMRLISVVFFLATLSAASGALPCADPCNPNPCAAGEQCLVSMIGQWPCETAGCLVSSENTLMVAENDDSCSGGCTEDQVCAVADAGFQVCVAKADYPIREIATRLANPRIDGYGYQAITVNPNPAVVFQNTHIDVKIGNSGANSASGITVDLAFNDWGLSFNGWQPIGSQVLSGPLVPTTSAMVGFDHTFLSSAHKCLQAKISSVDAGGNTVLTDDQAQMNLEVINCHGGGKGDASFAVPLSNDGEEPVSILQPRMFCLPQKRTSAARKTTDGLDADSEPDSVDDDDSARAHFDSFFDIFTELSAIPALGLTNNNKNYTDIRAQFLADRFPCPDGVIMLPAGRSVIQTPSGDGSSRVLDHGGMMLEPFSAVDLEIDASELQTEDPLFVVVETADIATGELSQVVVQLMPTSVEEILNAPRLCCIASVRARNQLESILAEALHAYEVGDCRRVMKLLRLFVQKAGQLMCDLTEAEKACVEKAIAYLIDAARMLAIESGARRTIRPRGTMPPSLPTSLQQGDYYRLQGNAQAAILEYSKACWKSYNNNTPRPGVFQRTTIDGVELQNLCSAPLCAAMFPPDSDQPDLDTNETRVDQIPEIPQTVLDTLGVPA